MAEKLDSLRMKIWCLGSSQERNGSLKGIDELGLPNRYEIV